MTPHTLVASVLVLLAGGTGLLWPKSNAPAEDAIKPVAVKTLSFREDAPALPPWLDAGVDAPPPAWTVRGDGLWVPWTMQPPAWLAAIAQGYVVAETIPLPPERPMGKNPLPSEGGSYPPQKRMAREGDLCARVGLKKTYTDKYRWRCRP
jgi:hypothetical protein